MKKPDSTHIRKLMLTLVLIALVAVVFILASGIDSVSPLAGKRLPNPFAGFGDIALSESTQGSPWGANTLRILIQALFALGAAAVLLFVIFSREHRKQFAIIAVFLLLITLILAQVREIPQSQQQVQLQNEMNTEIGQPPLVEQVEIDIPKVNPTNWQLIVIALGSSLVLTLAGSVFFIKVYPLLRSRSSNRISILNQLGKSAGLAAHRIVTGDDPRAAILRCYQEMTQIVSKHDGVPDHSYFTPREFASRLSQRGMNNKDVDRLTAIFEAVRYGGRSGADFVNEAISCLRSIHRTHALGEPV